MHKQLKLTWLGQAGFLIDCGVRAAIDPYLSDSLHEKYRNGRFPHERMMDIPVRPEELTGLSFVLCTHGHSDHMDPGTLPALAGANPKCVFICPASERLKAIERGVPSSRFRGMVQDGVFDDSAGSGLAVTAVASAHEELSLDDQGRSLFLGFVIDICGTRLYHSGDCVPYKGLAERLAELKIDAAMLPVNGRDETRASNGVPGNFTVEEAVGLCLSAGIGTLVPHHFGMFGFNTEDPEEIERILRNSGLQYIMPEAGKPRVLPGIK